MSHTPLWIIDEALELAHTTLDQIWEWDVEVGKTRMIRYLNKVKDRFWSWIVTSIGEDYGWDQWITDGMSGETEYPLLEVASDRNGTKKVEHVYIAYENKAYSSWKLVYTKARPVSRSSLEYEWEWYEVNQSKDDPIYILADQSVFIAPTPPNITKGVKVTGIRKIADYSEETTEPQMKITSEYSYVLVQGLLPYIYRYQAKISEANAETQEYERIERKALLDLGDRVSSPYFAQLP